mmetsp:Transcript_35255/g.80686  ORF Transcript_35255/g.80686 Transcript_35255/m.80686 type:complete len:92 (+) Transcript_35255:736-1011(+)
MVFASEALRAGKELPYRLRSITLWREVDASAATPKSAQEGKIRQGKIRQGQPVVVAAESYFLVPLLCEMRRIRFPVLRGRNVHNVRIPGSR